VGADGSYIWEKDRAHNMQVYIETAFFIVLIAKSVFPSDVGESILGGGI